MKLIWLDIETTGLDPATCQILEIAVAIADISNPFEAETVYNQPLFFHEGLERIAGRPPLSDFIVKMHTNNGLLVDCRASTKTFAQAEQDLLAIIPEDNEDMPVLAGSSVHFDHGFLKRWMPELSRRLSHRHYDVSAIKLFCQSLGMTKLPKAEAHRAEPDIRESIEHARLCADWALHG